jgi:DNA-directed RNA polymerase specialized sigma24 family protein
MSAEGSVTHWLGMLQTGDPAAAQPLLERYFRLLVSRARAALRAAPRQAADEEDVALSAFDSFCRGAQQGRFPKLGDRDNLWRLLVVLTTRTAAHLARDQRCLKRGGGLVRTEADLASVEADGEEGVLAQAIGSEPTPEFAASVAEECRRLLDKLADDGLRSIAVWRMEDYTVEEIAAKLGRSPRTVALKLNVIRDCWRQEGLS